MGPNGEKGSLKTKFLKSFSVPIEMKGMMGLHLNAHFSDPFDLHLKDISGQSKFRYPNRQHSSQNRKGFKDRHLIS